jgi:hypothetical protein
MKTKETSLVLLATKTTHATKRHRASLVVRSGVRAGMGSVKESVILPTQVSIGDIGP